MVSLDDWQYQLHGITFGPGTKYPVRTFDDGGKPSVQDQNASFSNYTRFGVDTLGLKTIRIGLGVMTDPGGDAAYDALGDLLEAWQNPDVYSNPGDVAELYLRRPGRETVTAYGRVREVKPQNFRAVIGWMPVNMQFEMADPLYYSASSVTNSVPLVTTSKNGWTWELNWPLTISNFNNGLVTVTNGGQAPTWITLVIKGKVTSPSVTVYNDDGTKRFHVSFSKWIVPDGWSISVDPRPWKRTYLWSDGSSVVPDRGSVSMENLRIPRGTYTVAFEGASASGSASCLFTVHNAYYTK